MEALATIEASLAWSTTGIVLTVVVGMFLLMAGIMKALELWFRIEKIEQKLDELIKKGGK